MTQKHVTYAERRPTSLVTAWRTATAKAFERQYADTSFIAATDQRRGVIYSQWRDLASGEGMRTNPDMVAYFRTIAALDSFIGDVVYNHHA
jgi:hypothetical protein